MFKALCIFVVLLCATLVLGGARQQPRICTDPAYGCSNYAAAATTLFADSETVTLADGEEYEEVGTLEEQVQCTTAQCLAGLSSSANVQVTHSGVVMNLEAVPNLGLFLRNGKCFSSCEWFYTKMNATVSACASCKYRYIVFENTSSCSELDYTKIKFAPGDFARLYDLCNATVAAARNCDCNDRKTYLPVGIDALRMLNQNPTPPPAVTTTFFKDIIAWGSRQAPSLDFTKVASAYKFIFSHYPPVTQDDRDRVVTKLCVRPLTVGNRDGLLLGAALLSNETSLALGSRCVWQVSRNNFNNEIDSQKDFLYGQN